MRHIRGALLLNASYEPLHLVPQERAVVLILQEKADVVLEQEGVFIHASSGWQMPAPSVIRLRKYVKLPYSQTVTLNRANLMVRDHNRCAYCGKRATTIDHVIPTSRGGPHTWENVVASCRRCNFQKGDKTLAEIGWSLPFTPAAPRGTGKLMHAAGMDVPEWEEYLEYLKGPKIGNDLDVSVKV